MNLGKFMFAQVMEHLPLHAFHRCVVRYSGEHKVKRFSCLDQYPSMNSDGDFTPRSLLA